MKPVTKLLAPAIAVAMLAACAGTSPNTGTDEQAAAERERSLQQREAQLRERERQLEEQRRREERARRQDDGLLGGGELLPLPTGGVGGGLLR